MNVLVISPHPDDESIGCGGTICKHVSEGDKVEVIFLTSGEKGGHGMSESETIAIREMEAQKAAQILNLYNIQFWRQPDGHFIASPDNIKRLKKIISVFKPGIIYVPHENEDHPDHRQAALLAKKAISGLIESQNKPTVFMYEVWTPIQIMNQIIDITPFIETKRKAILAHSSQCGVLKFDEAILGLNRYRGEMHSWPGGDYAEVFIQLNFEEKQKLVIDKIKNKVIKQYDKNSKLFKNQKKIYPELKHIKYVPKMTFKNGQITLNYCGPALFKLLKEKYIFEIHEKKIIKSQLIEFIKYLFEARIAHRDLHIGNICWDGKQIWVIDWDYACPNKVNEISQLYDLTGSGLESPSETNNVHIFKKSYEYPSINELLDPLQISLSDFSNK